MTTEPSRNELMKEQRLAAERFGKKDVKGFAPPAIQANKYWGPYEKGGSPLFADPSARWPACARHHRRRLLPHASIAALRRLFGRYLILCTRGPLCHPEHGARTQGYRLV